MTHLIEFQGNFVFYNIAQGYRNLTEMYGTEEKIPAQALYEATRKAWKSAPCRREKVQYAAAVYKGVIKAVYEVASWQECQEPQFAGRWEFNGSAATEAPQGDYVGKPASPHMPTGAPFVVAYNFKC